MYHILNPYISIHKYPFIGPNILMPSLVLATIYQNIRNIDILGTLYLYIRAGYSVLIDISCSIYHLIFKP